MLCGLPAGPEHCLDMYEGWQGHLSTHRERKSTGNSWCAYTGSVCVFLHAVVDPVFDRTSSDHVEVKAMCPDEAVVKY